jgi:imidazolonepropionase-like amidohydrolase
VDSIEHAYTIPDDALKMMAAKKIFLVPTDFPAEFYLPPDTLTPEQREAALRNIKGFTAGSRERLARAIKMGVRVSAGSDAYYAEPGQTRGQTSKLMFRAYAESGMSPLEIIRAATINNAELFMGERAQFGSIESGKFADLIAVAGDPLKEITELERVRFVMKGGTVVKDELTAAGAGRPSK